MKRICKEQYEKDFDEMFKLDKKGLMTDIDCYVSNLENSIKRLEEENQKLKKQIETLEKLNNQLISKIDRYDAIVDERDELKKQKEELRDYLKARIEVCDNRLSMPFCNFEKATKERLILSQCLDKLEEIIGDDK